MMKLIADFLAFLFIGWVVTLVMSFVHSTVVVDLPTVIIVGAIIHVMVRVLPRQWGSSC